MLGSLIKFIVFVGGLGLLGGVLTGAWRLFWRPRLSLTNIGERCRDGRIVGPDIWEDGSFVAMSYLRLHLENNGRGMASNCRIFLEEIRPRGGAPIADHQPSLLPWTDLGVFDAQRLEAGHDAYVDVACVVLSHPDRMIILSQRGIRTLLCQPNEYFVTISARSDWSITHRYVFTIKHVGDENGLKWMNDVT
jgi:hypothetical protein